MTHDVLGWQRLPAFKKLARTLYDHLEGNLAYCRNPTTATFEL